MLSTRITNCTVCRMAWASPRIDPHYTARQTRTTLLHTRTMPRPHPPSRLWPNSITTTRNRTRIHRLRHPRRPPIFRQRPRRTDLNFQPPPWLSEVAVWAAPLNQPGALRMVTETANNLHQFEYRWVVEGRRMRTMAGIKLFLVVVADERDCEASSGSVTLSSSSVGLVKAA